MKKVIGKPYKKGEGGRPKGVKTTTTRHLKEIQADLLDCFTKDDVSEIYDKLKNKMPSALLQYIGKIAPKDLNHKHQTEYHSPLADELKKMREKGKK